MKYADGGYYDWKQEELVCRYGNGDTRVVATKQEAEKYEEKKWYEKVEHEREANKSSSQLRKKMHTAALKEPPAWDEVERLAGLVAAAEVREDYALPAHRVDTRPGTRPGDPGGNPLPIHAARVVLCLTYLLVGFAISKLIFLL